MTVVRPEHVRPFIPMAAPVVSERESSLVADAVSTGWISSVGQYVKRFEESFAAYSGARHGIATTNGTTALHLALASLGLGPGDEVILPPITHIACANAVVLTGAKPVLADCSEETWGLDPRAVATKITKRTRAIMPVHLYGHPVDMDPLLAIAADRGIAVLEDAAEAHGAEYKGRRTGSLGTLGCFSFYANKIITTGEGGMLTTSSDELAGRARKLRDQAYEPERRFWHRELGFNYRLTNVQAAIGVAQMERIDEFVGTRRRNAQRYNEALSDCHTLTLPPEMSWAKNVYWMYSVLVSPAASVSRDRLIAELRTRGIDARTFFIPIHRQPLYESDFAGERYPVSEMLGERGINLPSGNELIGTEVDYIAATTRALLS